MADEEDGAFWLELHRLRFELDDGKPAPAGYRLRLPGDTFEHPPVDLDGVTVWPISPLALHQMRLGIARQGSFGELGEKQLRSLRELRTRFFPDRSDEELLPPIEPLAHGGG